MATNTGNRSIVKVIVGGAGLFIILFGMRLSSSILSPILLALIIGISVAVRNGARVTTNQENMRVPRPISGMAALASTSGRGTVTPQ